VVTPGSAYPAVGGDGGVRRPLNPFLSKDPNQRAKRLARALVSDIITYHPAKHAEGLRDGTLKQLFREEIKKSFEEYIAQVGQQLAESTTYFQEALNEVLGAGKKIF
jgi:L-amino acid N-acyltransferase YncA